MNFLCHAMPYFETPLVAAGTAVPDWLSVVDRKIRARGKLARQVLDSDDDELRCVASGVIRHIEDDRWFHGTQAFVETNMQLAVELREYLPDDEGFRPTFVGHILLEMLLDAFWIRDDRAIADRYYLMLDSVSAQTIERCVNTITGKPTDGLVSAIERFIEIRFLYDYLDLDKLLERVNQVLRRVRLRPLPDSVADWLPEASKLVESRRQRLLTPPDGTTPFPDLPNKSFRYLRRNEFLMKYGMNLLLWSGEVTDEMMPVCEQLKNVGYDGVELPMFNLDLDYAAIGSQLDGSGAGTNGRHDSRRRRQSDLARCRRACQGDRTEQKDA